MTISGHLGNNNLSPTLFQNKLTFWLCRVNLLSITSLEQTVSVPLCPKLQPSIKFNTQLQSIKTYSTTIRYILKYRIKLGNNKCFCISQHHIASLLDSKSTLNQRQGRCSCRVISLTLKLRVSIIKTHCRLFVSFFHWFFTFNFSYLESLIFHSPLFVTLFYFNIIKNFIKNNINNFQLHAIAITVRNENLCL